MRMGTSTSSASEMARCVASRSTSIGRACAWKRGAVRPAASSFFVSHSMAVGVLGVDHRHRAVLPRHRQHVEDLAVVELQVVVGHVDLERRVALADQRRQFLVQHLRRRVADDQVEGVVDMRLAFGAMVIVGHRGAQRLALVLRSERNHRGGAAAGRAARAAVEVIGHAQRRRHRLVEVAVRIDAARRDDPAGGVDLALAGRQSAGRAARRARRRCRCRHRRCRSRWRRGRCAPPGRTRTQP